MRGLLTLTIAVSLPLVAIDASYGATKKAGPKYRNCAGLNADYPNGVGKAGAVDKTKAEPVTSFTVDTALYNRLPKTLDRDKDGIACEKL